MWYRNPAAHLPSRARFLQKTILNARVWPLALSLCAVIAHAQTLPQQTYERDLDTPEKVSLTIRNRQGRVIVIAAEEHKRVSLRAESPGSPITEKDVRSSTEKSGEVLIDVGRARESAGSRAGSGSGGGDAPATSNRRSVSNAERERIDITVRVPVRARVRVETEAGAVDIVGNVESARVKSDTGTIRADVPLDSLRYSFQWLASRPRFYSEVELTKVRERRGGVYEIEGRFGDKKAKRDQRTELELATERGLILFGVSDPSMVPTDLRERALTESARAIIRSGDEHLISAIRKVVPRLVGDYTQTLPPRIKEPSLVERRPPGAVATRIEESLVSLNASVTDRQGRAIGGLTEKDFAVFENNERRDIKRVAPTNAPFNLILLLDVSGSVEERLDFIRKAALSFLNTVGAQDRIAIISFRDDVQLVSDFTTDRRVLTESIKRIDAGGGTALYDSLAYALVHTLKPLRGERTAIVILSDGDDNRSFVPFNSILDAVQESGALIYPLYIPSGLIPASNTPNPETTLDPMRARFLAVGSRAEDEGRKLASLSGGVYYHITRLEQLQQAYDDVVTQLRTAYSITFASSAREQQRRGSHIRVRVEREGASVRLSPAVSLDAAP